MHDEIMGVFMLWYNYACIIYNTVTLDPENGDTLCTDEGV